MIQHLYYETLIPFLKRLKKKKKIGHKNILLQLKIKTSFRIRQKQILFKSL